MSRMAEKPVVEEGLKLTLSAITGGSPLGPFRHRTGTLAWSNVFSGRETASLRFEVRTGSETGTVRLLYAVTIRATGERQDVDCTIAIAATPQPNGGIRWWWVCPHGHGLCGTLYATGGAMRFTSRHARRMSYRTQRLTPRDRALEKAQRIRASVGGWGDVSLFDPFPPKPKRMRWATWERKRVQAEAASGVSMAALLKHLDRTSPGWRNDSK